MIDWSNIFNIAVVSALGALVLFLLVSTIVVAAKGKRKCNAFDVILRIVAALLFIAATAMTVASVFTMLTSGSFRIGFIGAGESVAPVLVVGDSSIELPLPELFELLSTAIGLMLSALLFICSLAALVVDCLVANKKSEKRATAKVKKPSKQTKSPEQLKREAELEKIRRIGENAVRKTSEAAKASEPKHTDDRQNAQTPSAIEDRVDESAPQEPDWRVEQKQQNTVAQSSFVGISENTDPDFDTFDSFDTSQAEGQATYAETETDAAAETYGNDAEELFDMPRTEQSEEDPGEEDTLAPNTEEEDPFVADDGYSEAEPDGAADFDLQAEEDERSDEQDNYEEADGTSVDPIAERSEEYESEYADNDGEVEYDGVTENATDEEYYDGDGEENDITEPEREEEHARSSAVERQSTERGAGALREEDDYEPDRGIYIPGIRTIVKRSGVQTNAKQDREKAPTQTRASSVTGAKRASAKRDVKKTANAPKAPAPARTATAGKRAAAAKTSPVNAASENNKKLPVTRRYVILDRRNAVNMFGEYLKDREQAQKDKLKSSINTIIIE